MSSSKVKIIYNPKSKSDYRVSYPLTSNLISRNDVGALEKLYKNELKISENKIQEILQTKYNYSLADAKRLSAKINSDVISKLSSLYEDIKTYNEDNVYGNLGEGSIRSFNHWLQIVTAIPLYHSLGDTIGYYNGNWEFNYGNPNMGPDYVNDMIDEFIDFGGINDISLKNWRSSDDTILYLDTFQVLSEPFENINEFGQKLREAYLASVPSLVNRHPGVTTMNSLDIQQNIQWDKLPYNSRAIGAGSVMRSGCIGIFFPGKEYRYKLIKLAVECSRITHNSATAIIGSVAAALFTAYALEKVSINLWPHKLLKIIKSTIIDDYIKETRPSDYNSFMRDKLVYVGQMQKYITIRFSGINPRTDLRLMTKAVQRYKYLSENFSKNCDIPGSCGDDCIIFAYDALLQSNGTFEKMIVYSTLHPGDSDTVGATGMGFFGGFYHSVKNERIIASKVEQLEFIDRIIDLTTSDNTTIILMRIYLDNIYMNIARKYINEYTKR